MKRIIHFIQYHNAASLFILFAFATGTFALASEDVRETVIGQEVVTETGVDNVVILAADFDAFNPNLTITSVQEDNEYYYVQYAFETFAIQENAWQKARKQNTLRVLKKELEERERTLESHINEELGEVIQHDLAYLRKVQEGEQLQGVQEIKVAREYTGLIGLAFNVKEGVFPGTKEEIPEKETLSGVFDPNPEQLTISAGQLKKQEPAPQKNTAKSAMPDTANEEQQEEQSGDPAEQEETQEEETPASEEQEEPIEETPEDTSEDEQQEEIPTEEQQEESLEEPAEQEESPEAPAEQEVQETPQENEQPIEPTE